MSRHLGKRLVLSIFLSFIVFVASCLLIVLLMKLREEVFYMSSEFRQFCKTDNKNSYIPSMDVPVCIRKFNSIWM